MNFYDYIGSPKTTANEKRFCEDFSIARRNEALEYGMDSWEAASGSWNYVGRLAVGHDGNVESRILKVPHRNPRAQQLGRAECDSMRLVAATRPAFPFVTSNLLRQHENPFYFVMTDAGGTVLPEDTEFSEYESHWFGRDLGRIASWGTQVGAERYRAAIERPYGKLWDWHKLFDNLEGFTDKRYPNLSAVAQEMHALRHRFYSRDWFDASDLQFIHGDLRRENMTFTGSEGSRRLYSVFDWGAARLGILAEEARSLHRVGAEAIEGYNSELDAHNLPSVDPEAVRFWDVGRCVAGLVAEVTSGIQSPDEFIFYLRDRVSSEYPELDWSELSAIDARIFDRGHLSGLPFARAFST